MRLALGIGLACGMAIAQPPEVRRWADYWATEYNVERELVYAVIEAESGGNARAVSSAGAAGIMQLMPTTAAAFGVRNRFDVNDNIRGGVAYLAWLRQKFGGDRRLVVAAYISGADRVLRAGLRSPYSDEVRNYVERVAHLYRRNRWETLIRKEP